MKRRIMKRYALPLILSLAGLLLLACGPAAVGTPTSAPGPTPGPTIEAPTVEVPTEVPTVQPTPAPVAEWEVEEVLVDGSTVTVELRVFAGVQLDVTLDGVAPDSTSGPDPLLHYVFRDVTPGEHSLLIEDVVGHRETRQVTVTGMVYSDEFPSWLSAMIRDLESQTPANPPRSILRYQYQGQVVYYLTETCCDIFSDLYAADGNLLGHPDGGITGGGDGRVTDFADARSDEHLIWQDSREPVGAGSEDVLAPVDEIELNIAESFPLQYFLRVVSGLPSGCVTYGGYTVTRDGDRVLVRMYNLQPTDRELACTMIYGIKETSIPLGSDFDPATRYVVDVNGQTLSFQNDQVLGTDATPAPTPVPTPARLQQQLNQNRELWDSQGWQDYRMEFQWSCFCVIEYVSPVVVTVSGGDNIDAVVFAENGQPVGELISDGYETVDGLFDLIQDAIDRNAFSISVEYHPELGYPISASIDYDQMMADEERGFVVTSVVPVE
jgi:hypothetical protein